MKILNVLLLIVSIFCFSQYEAYAYSEGYRYNMSGTFHTPLGSYTLNNQSFISLLGDINGNGVHTARVSINAYNSNDQWVNGILMFQYDQNRLSSHELSLSKLPGSDFVNHGGLHYFRTGQMVFPQGEYIFRQFMDAKFFLNSDRLLVWYGAENTNNPGRLAFKGDLNFSINSNGHLIGGGNGGSTGPSNPIPEPMTMSLLGAGLLGGIIRKKRSKTS